MKSKFMLTAVLAVLITVAAAQAAIMSAGASAPVVDGQDIASYGTPNGQDKWWPGPANAYGNPGKTVGQTFTTGGEDVMLNAFTFQIRNATVPTKEYTIRVGTISDGTFTEIHSETATQSFAWDADSYVTWTFAQPVLLSANTVYGVDVGLNSSTSPWNEGIPYVYRTPDDYPDGTRFRSGTEGYGVGDETMTQVAGDRVFHIDLSLVGASNPEPINGATVSAGNVELSWTNADPNTPGDSVYVDVWFGTDPNKLNPAADYTKVVDATVDGENRISVTVDASAPGTYYWQVNSYINGAGNINEPNMIEGPLWTFYTVSDQSPEIEDAGVDMITWSGQPVQLDPVVTDDGMSDLTWAWSAFPADGVVFTPGADHPNPTVTITKEAGVAVIGLYNAGFEDPRDDPNLPVVFEPYPDGDRDYAGHLQVYDWTWPNWGYYFNGYCGVYNPVAGDYNTGEAPEGQNVGFVESYSADDDPYYTPAGGLSLTLPTELEANTGYTLTVKVGNPLYNDEFPGYRVQLVAGGSVLAQDANSLIPSGEWITSTVKYTSGDSVTPGQKLSVRLMTMATVVGEPGGALTYEVHFDDVKLVSDGDATYTLTLAVSDENNPPVEDTMTIDVYDNACLAKIGAGLATDYPADYTADCIINIEDMAVMAATWLDGLGLGDLVEMAGTWLVDYDTLTEPVVKP